MDLKHATHEDICLAKIYQLAKRRQSARIKEHLNYSFLCIMSRPKWLSK